MRVLVLGASGMLGSAMLRVLSEDSRFEVFASARSASVKQHFSPGVARHIVTGVDVENPDALARLFCQIRPDAVINCIGLIKQLAEANDPLLALPVNALLPHRLARICELGGARLIHISTDCVFAGTRGNYLETDPSDAADLYGQSKYLGEVAYPHAITLRTSIIGHELETAYALLCWFLQQEGSVKGYTKAIFSGLPTVELARIVGDEVLTRPGLSGLYHVASAPIAKYDLLRLVAATYGKQIEIIPDDALVIDRSLNAERFSHATGYRAPSWPDLVRQMFELK